MDSREKIRRQISIARRETLTVVEIVWGASPQWPFVRSQLLRILGERGLEGRLLGFGQDDGTNIEKNQGRDEQWEIKGTRRR